MEVKTITPTCVTLFLAAIAELVSVTVDVVGFTADVTVLGLAWVTVTDWDTTGLCVTIAFDLGGVFANLWVTADVCRNKIQISLNVCKHTSETQKQRLWTQSKATTEVTYQIHKHFLFEFGVFINLKFKEHKHDIMRWDPKIPTA